MTEVGAGCAPLCHFWTGLMGLRPLHIVKLRLLQSMKRSVSDLAEHGFQHS
jgi:hypothetical protein